MSAQKTYATLDKCGRGFCVKCVRARIGYTTTNMQPGIDYDRTKLSSAGGEGNSATYTPLVPPSRPVPKLTRANVNSVLRGVRAVRVVRGVRGLCERRREEE